MVLPLFQVKTWLENFKTFNNLLNLILGNSSAPILSKVSTVIQQN